MAIKFEKIKAGMTLYDRRSQLMGNTTMRSVGEWRVQIISVDEVGRSATVSWNTNRPEVWAERRLTRLYDWSMHDKEVATYKSGLMGAIWGVRKLTKAELAERKAVKELESRTRRIAVERKHSTET